MHYVSVFAECTHIHSAFDLIIEQLKRGVMVGLIANTYFQLSDYKVIAILEMFVVYSVRLSFCVL